MKELLICFATVLSLSACNNESTTTEKKNADTVVANSNPAASGASSSAGDTMSYERMQTRTDTSLKK
ncbi:MAG: hypothetical protein H7Y27_09670 [Gemmatimonadaceae bacterium]|nr:hypothetical protein [Chitinophagaceae bacterium]